jgi:threonine/homoserine/homoserine lactone efflux protein
MIEHIGAFLAISAVIIVTPGPDTALTIRNTLLGARRGGVFTAIGVATGQAVWTLATSAGVAALLLASAPAFAAVRLVGAAYLVYLGLRALIAAARGRRSPDAGEPVATPLRLAPGAAFRQGVLSNLANPKMAVFFTSLLPQFTGRGGTPFASLLLLGAIFCTMTLAWLTLYAVAVARVGAVLHRAGVRRALEGVMGAVLVAFGLRLAVQHR